jgi:hypothetical protein
MTTSMKILGATAQANYVIFEVIFAGKILPIFRADQMLIHDRKKNELLAQAKLHHFIGGILTADVREVHPGDKYTRESEAPKLDETGKLVLDENQQPIIEKRQDEKTYERHQLIVDGFMFFELNETNTRALASAQ